MKAVKIPAQKKKREETYKKITSKNENYTLYIAIKELNSIYITIKFNGDNKTYEDIKTYEDFKKQQAYFEDYSLEEIFEEICDLISKNNFEFNKNNEQILLKIILPLKKKKTVDFILEVKKLDNIYDLKFLEIIKQKDEIIKKQEELIKQKDDIISQKDEIIKQKDNIIKNLEYIIDKEKEITEKNKKERQMNKDNGENDKILKGFNISKQNPEYNLTTHGKNIIYSIIKLQDGRLASGGKDGSLIIYDKKTFDSEMIIREHTGRIYDIIQLKNGNLLSCCYEDKTINEYVINESKTYKLISKVNSEKDNSPLQMKELENGEIGLVAYNSLIFYSNLNNKLKENYSIQYNENQIGKFYEMLPVKSGELVISGSKDKIQFFEINSRKLKEIIDINTVIRWTPSNLFCMMNERCLCVGGQDKITIIDIYNKNIIREIKENGAHRCLLKLNDNVLLSGKDGDIIEWEISENNLKLVGKKEKAHQSSIIEIIRFNNSIASCSNDNTIKIW